MSEVFKFKALVILLIFFISIKSEITNSKPPMGWQNSITYGCGISESIIKSVANNLISTNLAKLGFNYININNCFETEIDVKGNILPLIKQFPNGIKNISYYLHQKGMKLGLPLASGKKNEQCNGLAGSTKYLKNDINTYISWGVDYIKFYSCIDDEKIKAKEYELISSKIKKRNIFLSINEMNDYKKLDPLYQDTNLGNSLQIGPNVKDNWESIIEKVDLKGSININKKLNYWNDFGPIKIGNTKINLNEFKTQLGLWIINKSPLILEGDISQIPKEYSNLLTNEGAISINQDPLGIPGKRVITRKYFINDSMEMTKGDSLETAKCNGKNYQQWIYQKDKTITNYNKKLCLELETENKFSYILKINNCDKNKPKNQLWEIKGNKIINLGTKLCLAKINNSKIIGTKCKNKKELFYQNWSYSQKSKNLRHKRKCLTPSSYVKSTEVWTVPMKSNSMAILMINRGLTKGEVKATFKELDLLEDQMDVIDIWENKTLGKFKNEIIQNLEGHSSSLLKVNFKCPKGCISCISPTICTKCEPNLYIIKQIDNLCRQVSDINNDLVIPINFYYRNISAIGIIAVIAVLTIVIICFCDCCWKKKIPEKAVNTITNYVASKSESFSYKKVNDKSPSISGNTLELNDY